MQDGPDDYRFTDMDRGNKILRSMQEQGVKNSDLVEITGLSRQKITRVTSGSSNNLNDMITVCKALGLSLDYVCGISNELDQGRHEVMRKLDALPKQLAFQVVNLIEAMYHRELGAFELKRRRTDR